MMDDCGSRLLDYKGNVLKVHYSWLKFSQVPVDREYCKY